MATPSSPIGFSNIYSEANGVAPVSATSLDTLAQRTYFQGPNGTNAVGFNCWGQGEGNNGIYAVQSLTGNLISFNNYREVSYYYDNNQYQVSLNIINNTSTDDFTVTVYYMDTTLTYNYLVMSAGTIFPASSFPAQVVSQTNSPLIYGCNWNLQIESNPFYAGTADVSMDINGVGVLGATTIPAAFPTPVFFDYTSNTNEFMTPGYPTGVPTPITGVTGSEIIIDIR